MSELPSALRLTRHPDEEPGRVHYHKDERGVLVRCYHRGKALLSQPSFWIGTTLSFPIEHFLWEKVWPFTVVTKLLGM